MFKQLFGNPERQEEPRDEATIKFYELAALYTLSFHPNEPKPEGFYDRIEQLEHELGEERARAAREYARNHESFYYKLMY